MDVGLQFAWSNFHVASYRKSSNQRGQNLGPQHFRSGLRNRFFRLTAIDGTSPTLFGQSRRIDSSGYDDYENVILATGDMEPVHARNGQEADSELHRQHDQRIPLSVP